MSTDETYKEQIKREAREWHTRMNDGDVDSATRAAFEGWLHADKANKDAYHALEQMWRDLDYAAVEAEVDVTGALASPTRLGWHDVLGGWFGRPAWAFGGAAAFASIAVAFFAVVSLQPSAPPVDTAAPEYATAIAEIREITLEDGSIVTLGAKSELDVVFDPDKRQVTLLAGEAFFDVAKDPSRPFFVSVDDTLIRVVGTKFDVKRTAGDVHVSVLEGTVDVMKTEDLTTAKNEALGRIETKRLSAGQKIIADQRPQLPDVREIETATPGAWRAGRLAYEDASLFEIVADVNRYSDRPIRIASGDIGDIRFTLGFQTSEIDTWLSMLEETQPVRVIDRGTGEIVLQPRR